MYVCVYVYVYLETSSYQTFLEQIGSRWHCVPALLDLAAQAQSSQKLSIAADIGVLQIIQQSAPLADHFKQPTAGVVVFAMLLQMPGEVLNPRGQQGYLDLRRAGIRLVPPEFINDLLLILYSQSQFAHLISLQPRSVGTSGSRRYTEELASYRGSRRKGGNPSARGATML